MGIKIQGLTGKKVQIHGLLGRKARIRVNSSGKLTAYFDLGTGSDIPEDLKYCTWSHCVAYGLYAENLRNINTGELIYIEGFATTEGLRGDDDKPLIENGQIKKNEYNVAEYLEIIPRNEWNNYLIKNKQLPLVVGQD